MRYFALLGILFCSTIYAQPATQPSTQPAELNATPVTIQKFKEMTYFYTELQTDVQSIGAVAGPTIGALFQTMKDNNLDHLGGVIFVYPNMPQDMSKPFAVQIGCPVPDTAQPVGEFKVRKLPEFECASMVLVGPMSLMPKAYEKLFTCLFSTGKQPTGECRELYHYWEDMESANNVTQIQAGVK